MNGLDFTSTPLIDRADFPSLLSTGCFGPWSEQAESLHRDGLCLVDLGEESLLELVDELVLHLQPHLGPSLAAWERGEGGPPRLQDGWKEHADVGRLALQPKVFDLLRCLYGREPFAFQTLNFAVGSEQHYHSDAVHFHSYPHGFMCGLWIALQDVEPGSGPLIYYPGSHRLPYLTAEGLGLHPEQLAAEPHPQKFFESHWQRAVDELGLERVAFLPRKGQALVWHANLLHGGESVLDRTSRRWSQVTHYFFADCLYTTPLQSFGAAHGGPWLRNPFDVATGRRRYSEREWEALGLTPAPLLQQDHPSRKG